jgi:hypothetical protein
VQQETYSAYNTPSIAQTTGYGRRKHSAALACSSTSKMISDLADMVAAKELIMFFETHPFSQLSNAFDKYYEPYKFRKVLLDMSI